MPLVVALAVALLVGCGVATGQTLPATEPSDTWSPFGAGTAVIAGDIMYAAGEFDYVGPRTGSFAAFDASNQLVAGGPPGFKVACAAAAPGGGWILSGTWNRGVGQAMTLRLGTSGAVDFTWSVEGAPQEYRELLIGGGVLYASTGVDVRAFDLATGRALPWTVSVSGDDGVITDAQLSGHLLLLVGRFTTVNGVVQPAYGFAAVDLSTAVPLPLVPAGLVAVEAASAQGGELFLTGFSDIATLQRSGVVITVGSGQSRPWPVNVPMRQIVAGPGGVFGRADSPSIGAPWPLVRIDAASGSLSAALVTDAVAMELRGAQLAVIRHTTVRPPYGRQGYHVSHFDMAGGFLSSPVVMTFFDPSGRTDGSHTIGTSSNGGLFVTGMDSAGGQDGFSNFAAIDLRAGRPVPSHVSFDGRVRTMIALGDVLIAAGRFTSVNGVPAAGLVAVTTSGVVLPWTPTTDGAVDQLAVVGARLYVAGDFAIVNGQSRPRLAAFDLPFGTLASWVPAPNTTSPLAIQGGNGSLYVSGDFTTIAGVARPGPVEFTAAGDLTAWRPALPAFSTARVAAVTPDGTAIEYCRAQSAGCALALVDRTGRTTAHQPIGPSAGGGNAIVSGDVLLGRGRALDVRAGAALAWASDMSPVTANQAWVVGWSLADDTLGAHAIPGADSPRHLRQHVTGDRVVLDWEPPPGGNPSGFQLDVYQNDTFVGAVSTGGRSIAASVPAAAYEIRLRTVAGGIAGPLSPPLTFSVPAPTTPPARPQLVSSTSGWGISVLQWRPGGPGHPESYQIEAGSAPGLSDLAVFDTGNADWFLLVSPPPGTYYVRVRARNGIGLSAPSHEHVLVVY